MHGVDAAAYQAFVNNSTAQGYAPVLVSATGSFSNATFAAVFEQGVVGLWLARHAMPSGPASKGLTSHGAPAITPTASIAGQPGGTGENHRVA